MKIKTLAAAAVMVAGATLVPMTGWACDMAGPNAHVGFVTAVNEKAHTFTIRDAQTQQLITFKASGQILKAVPASQQILVKYKKDADKLTAVSIKV